MYDGLLDWAVASQGVTSIEGPCKQGEVNSSGTQRLEMFCEHLIFKLSGTDMTCCNDAIALKYQRRGDCVQHFHIYL